MATCCNAFPLCTLEATRSTAARSSCSFATTACMAPASPRCRPAPHTLCVLPAPNPGLALFPKSFAPTELPRPARKWAPSSGTQKSQLWCDTENQLLAPSQTLPSLHFELTGQAKNCFFPAYSSGWHRDFVGSRPVWSRTSFGWRNSCESFPMWSCRFISCTANRSRSGICSSRLNSPVTGSRRCSYSCNTSGFHSQRQPKCMVWSGGIRGGRQ
mmetsp:Transcript_26309/g.66353  ORF Transcript_26309/g.66353 Transcript_26309/m.66353 type:complete len:214 (-) Transcript_26309:575-1216(-)